MTKEFDINKVYTKEMTKQELIELLSRTYDKEFIITFLPRAVNNADILIRSTEEELNKRRVKK